jgi:hypothetical protein
MGNFNLIEEPISFITTQYAITPNTLTISTDHLIEIEADSPIKPFTIYPIQNPPNPK